MKKSTVNAQFESPIEVVWDIVTDNKNYGWRSDIQRIAIHHEGNRFTEYTSNGFETEFTITEKETYVNYEFDMKNKNMTGHWSGVFSVTETGGTEITFTEEVSVKNPIMGLFIGFYLAKQQFTYIKDLKKALGE